MLDEGLEPIETEPLIGSLWRKQTCHDPIGGAPCEVCGRGGPCGYMTVATGDGVSRLGQLAVLFMVVVAILVYLAVYVSPSLAAGIVVADAVLLSLAWVADRLWRS